MDGQLLSQTFVELTDTMVAGFDVMEHPMEVKKRIGYLPETPPLYPEMEVVEYLTFVGRMHLLPRNTIRERSDELLALLDLANEEKKLSLEYSTGMKKKLALAAALLPAPELLGKHLLEAPDPAVASSG